LLLQPYYGGFKNALHRESAEFGCRAAVPRLFLSDVFDLPGNEAYA
jgi:hypothetical protein